MIKFYPGLLVFAVTLTKDMSLDVEQGEFLARTNNPYQIPWAYLLSFHKGDIQQN